MTMPFDGDIDQHWRVLPESVKSFILGSAAAMAARGVQSGEVAESSSISLPLLIRFWSSTTLLASHTRGNLATGTRGALFCEFSFLDYA